MDLQSLERQALAATLDSLAVGVIIVTDENRIVHTNQAGLRMLAKGHPVRAVNGCLAARDTTAIDRLAKAIALALHSESQIGPAGIGVALGSAFREPAIAQVLPLGHGDVTTRFMPQRTAAVFIVPAVRGPIFSLAAVADCLRLTRSEARLVEQLVTGATLAEAAVSLGIANTTAKTHLTHIFGKTGVSRQVELIALIHRLLPPVQKPVAA